MDECDLESTLKELTFNLCIPNLGSVMKQPTQHFVIEGVEKTLGPPRQYE